MPSKAEINVNINGNTTGFNNAINTAGIKVQSFVTGQLKQLGASIAAAFTVRQISAFIKETTQMAGRLVDMSDKTKMGVNSLQALEFMGNQAGISLDTISSAILRMNKSIAEARGGKEELIDAFSYLNISIDSLESKSPEDIFDEITKAMHNLNNENKAQLAIYSIFGKTAGELEKMFSNIGKMGGIKELNSNLIKIGLAIDENLIKKIDEVGKASEVLGSFWKTFFTKYVGAGLAGVGYILGDFKGYVKEIIGMGEHGGFYGKLQSDITKDVERYKTTPPIVSSADDNIERMKEIEKLREKVDKKETEIALKKMTPEIRMDYLTTEYRKLNKEYWKSYDDELKRLEIKEKLLELEKDITKEKADQKDTQEKIKDLEDKKLDIKKEYTLKIKKENEFDMPKFGELADIGGRLSQSPFAQINDLLAIRISAEEAQKMLQQQMLKELQKIDIDLKKIGDKQNSIII